MPSLEHQKLMKSGSGMQVQVSDNNGGRTVGEIRVQIWSKKERTIRALKFGGMCWVAGIVCVIIPLLHFILVPGFMIAGPVVAIILAGIEREILGGEGTCPTCGSFLPIARTTFRFPFSDLCTNCHSSLKIEQHLAQSSPFRGRPSEKYKR